MIKLPDLQTHKNISKLLIGEECEITNKIIDYPVRFLGRNHRIFFHDPISAALIGILTGEENGMYSALLHLVIDKYSTNQLAKLVIEYLK